jgi:hypothetical protein
LILAFSSIDSKVRRHRSHTRDTKTNTLYQFLVGVISALGGKDNNVDACLATLPGWEAAAVAETTSADGLEKTADVSQKGTWETIFGYLGAAIDICCSIKSFVTSFFTRKRLRWVRRNRRLFLQGKRMKRFSWSFSTLWTKVKDTVKGAYSAVTAGLKKVKNAVVDGIDWVKATVDQVTAYIEKKK